MLIVSRNNVRKLQISNLNRIYALPSCVFSCLELRAFAIYNCIFNPPLEFQGFPNLEELRFKKVHFGGNLGGAVINLPRLKYLTLETCDNVKSFNIKAINLKAISVIHCPDAMLLRLLQSECLDMVYICLLEPPIEDLQGVERFDLITMLSNLPKLSYFGIDGYFLKFLATQKFPKRLPHAVKCLKELGFQNFTFGDLDQVQGALCMLRNSPNLKVLSMSYVPMGLDDDLELTSNYLESPDCLHMTLLKLQNVELTSLEGSKPELLFIKFLLNHAPHLENMIIRPRATADAEKMLNIAKDVMMFPRASRKAKMLYLDPVS
ncbi:hypothetical protein SSX86_023154 [Deinandra increscens subsp. villosa]|uniref:FBD domain-containing protein n=1 Tax=Deinandra increscens subsp. villosa TaxID=3103831 RepID=A0AAP0CRY8_9ASTR